MIAPARRAALDALRLIDERSLDLGAALAQVREHLHDERDHALLLELVAGTLRMRAAVDYQIASRLNRPLERLDAAVLRILRLGAFQLLYLSRLPVSAVINDAVDLTRRSGKTSAAGLTNAVLRALAREREALSWPDRTDLLTHLSIVHSHPAWLVARWLARHDEAHTEQWLRFNNEAASMCLAVNRHLTDRARLSQDLRQLDVETEPTTRARDGLVVRSGRPLATAFFKEGQFVVQDEASQLIAELAASEPGARVLDLCASPGGKSVSLSVGRRLLVGCDVRTNRVRLLQRTLRRCRIEHARIVHIPATGELPFQAGAFDVVLIDAPCSGLGTIRRDPDIRWRRTAADLPELATAQRALVSRAANLVRAGGVLVYATCSSEPEENEEVVAATLSDRPDFSLERTHHTLPFRDGLEAFFGAVLRRAL